MTKTKRRISTILCAAVLAATSLSGTAFATNEDVSYGDFIPSAADEEDEPEWLYLTTNLDPNVSSDVKFELILEYSPEPIEWKWNDWGRSEELGIKRYTLPLTSNTSYNDIVNITDDITFSPTDKTLEQRFGIYIGDGNDADEWTEYQYDYCGIGYSIGNSEPYPTIALELVDADDNVIDDYTQISGNEENVKIKAISSQVTNPDIHENDKAQVSNIMLTFVVTTPEGKHLFRVGDDFDFVTLGLITNGVIECTEYVDDNTNALADETLSRFTMTDGEYDYIVVKNNEYTLVFEGDKYGCTNSISLISNDLYVQNQVIYVSDTI